MTGRLRVTEDPVLAPSIGNERAAFLNPLLLDGQAARAGLSCESRQVSGAEGKRAGP